MEPTLLSEIHDKSNQWTICVLVSRMWNYRGGTDHGAIMHTDLVLLDKEGNHMYGQIPPDPAGRFKDVLQEGRVYVIRKFFCNLSKPVWRPVESQYMVQFTRYTVVQEMPGLEEVYPFCTYSLTPLPELPPPTPKPRRFIDVIGRITMVSDIVPIQSMYQSVPSDTRTVVLADLLGNEIKITLWGERALEFEADAVRTMGEKEPVIAIFVGTVSKMTYGTKSLSGGSACRWYIDEDIPDIEAFRASLKGAFVPLVPYAAPEPNAYAIRAQQPPIAATVLELTNLDPFEDMNKRFHCDVTVDRVTPDKRWFFASCSTCRKSARYINNQYQCSDSICKATHADHAYCISIMGTDGTAEAEFVLFDKVAAAAVGKSLGTLLQQRYPGHVTIEEAAHAARIDASIPPEISRLVGQKYKLMVSISKKSQFTNTDGLSFQINRIEETFRPELPATVFGGTSLPGGASSSAPLTPGTIRTGTPFPAVSRSPAPQPHTPPPYGTPGKSSLGVRRGVKRSLFSTPPSAKKIPEADAASATNQMLGLTAASTALDASSSVATEPDALQRDVDPTIADVQGTMQATVVSSVTPVSGPPKAGGAPSVPSQDEKTTLAAATKSKKAAAGGKSGGALKKTK